MGHNTLTHVFTCYYLEHAILYPSLYEYHYSLKNHNHCLTLWVYKDSVQCLYIWNIFAILQLNFWKVLWGLVQIQKLKVGFVMYMDVYS